MIEKESTGDTKGKILDVAQDLIQRFGLNTMSFQHLSDAVGIKKSSVHHHFPSKDLMVNALLTRYIDDFDVVVKEILNSRTSGKTKLKRYCGLFLGTLENSEHEKSCLCGMLAAEMFSLNDDGLVLVRKFMSGNVEYIREMIRAGIEDGSLGSKSDAAGTADLVLATLEGGLLIARCDGGPKQLADVIKRLLVFLSSDA